MRMSRGASLTLLLLCVVTRCLDASEEAASESANQKASNSVAVSESTASIDQDAPGGPFLLFIKLRPSKTRTKSDAASISRSWKPQSWGAEGKIDLSVIDNDALVLTSESLSDAMKAKDWLLTQTVVYEMELNKGGEVFRRPGDGPIEDLRRRLARQAQEERRERGWAWLRHAAKRQGVRIKRPRHWGKTGGWRGRGRGRAGQGQLPGNKRKQEL